MKLKRETCLALQKQCYGLCDHLTIKNTDDDDDGDDQHDGDGVDVDTDGDDDHRHN